MIPELPFWLPFAFFFVAFIYSSVGFAGGSSYLLVLALAGFSHRESAPIALICNLAVSSVTFWHFFKAGHFRFRLIMPFMAFSIPLAFLGAKVPIGKQAFLLLLGLSLMFAAFRIFFLREGRQEKKKLNFKELCMIGFPAGGIMGFFSGLIGIGGGIFLSPFLLLTRLANMKEASAAASFFIFVNSLSGLLGKMQNGFQMNQGLLVLAVSALGGGWIGSRLGSNRLSIIQLQRILAGVILFISTNLILKVF